MALQIENIQERKDYLYEHAPYDFLGIKFPLKKLNHWANSYYSEGRHCSYGDEVDILLADAVWHRLEKKETVNLSILKDLLKNILLQQGLADLLRKYLYDSSWASSFAKRHGFPSTIYGNKRNRFEFLNFVVEYLF